MIARHEFGGPAVVLRVLGVSVSCAICFILDRAIPLLLGFEYTRIQNTTLYLWLLVFPVLGYSWIFQRSCWLSSVSPRKRWLAAVGIAVFLSIAFAFVILASLWMFG